MLFRSRSRLCRGHNCLYSSVYFTSLLGCMLPLLYRPFDRNRFLWRIHFLFSILCLFIYPVLHFLWSWEWNDWFVFHICQIGPCTLFYFQYSWSTVCALARVLAISDWNFTSLSVVAYVVAIFLANFLASLACVLLISRCRLCLDYMLMFVGLIKQKLCPFSAWHLCAVSLN